MDITRIRIKAPVEITQLKLGVPQNYRQEMINELYRIGDKMGHSTNVKAIMTNYELWNDSPKFKPFLNNIKKIVDKTQILDSKYENLLVSAWGSIYKKDHHAVPHSHEPAIYSWVYYLKTDEYSSPLMFEGGELAITVEDDLLVIFPGYLWHTVPPQKEGGDRLVLAGNYIWSLKNNKNNKKNEKYI